MLEKTGARLPAISPFDLDPSPAGVDYFTAYWYAAMSQAAYFSDEPTKANLALLAGGTAVETISIPGALIPKADLILFPAGRGVLVIQGTRFFAEFVNQSIGSVLTASAPWTGRVGAYWSIITLQLWDEILPRLNANNITNVALCGHSQGGAIAQLMCQVINSQPGKSVACLCSFGAPRSGDVTYADSQTNRYLRCTNDGDPIPLLPAAPSTLLDNFLWVGGGFDFNAYKHWGTRVYFTFAGEGSFQGELPSWAVGYAALITAARASSSWFASHFVAEYARRIRLNLPQPFNVFNPDYLGLSDLDSFFQTQALEAPAATWFNPEYCN